jgi:hypothetical protein
MFFCELLMSAYHPEINPIQFTEPEEFVKRSISRLSSHMTSTRPLPSLLYGAVKGPTHLAKSGPRMILRRLAGCVTCRRTLVVTESCRPLNPLDLSSLWLRRAGIWSPSCHTSLFIALPSCLCRADILLLAFFRSAGDHDYRVTGFAESIID